MGQWYVYDAQKGPFAIDEFAVYMISKDPARVHVWRPGLEAWVLAQDMAELSFWHRPLSRDLGLHDAELRAEGRVVADEPRRPTHKSRWARNGALIGLTICALDVLE